MKPKKPSKPIPDDVRKAVEHAVEIFNKENFRQRGFGFVARFHGKHVYLDLAESGDIRPRCRITYAGKLDDWEFAIYKYSDEAYDADEFMFPGADHVDGTIGGAMKAALEAYS